jgi:hypothetical protein
MRDRSLHDLNRGWAILAVTREERPGALDAEREMIDQLKNAGLTVEQARTLTRILRDSASSGELAEIVAGLEERVDALCLSLARVEKSLRLADIRTFLKNRARKRAAHPTLPQLFTIDLICSDDPDLASVTRPELYLDDKGLEAQYARTLPQVGAIRRAGKTLNALAFRLSGKLARRYAERLKLPVNLLREAWFHSILMEVWHVVAARHIARRIAVSAAGEPVIIPIGGVSLPYLSHGAESRKIDRFYIAAELQRRGVPVAFVCSDPELLKRVRSGEPGYLRFEPFKDLWVPAPLPGPPLEPSGEERVAVIGAGIRGVNQILARHPDALRVQSGYVFDPAFGTPEAAVVDTNHLPVALTFPLYAEDDEDVSVRDLVLLSTTLTHSDLGEYLCVALGGATAAATQRARELVQRHRLTEAHVCEHAFYESAIVANAVKESGGRVVLWPHSFNPAFPEFRLPGTVDAVNCVLESGAATWRARLPDAEVSVIPNFWLPRYQGPQPASPAEPLTVVVICNEFGYTGIDYMNRWILEVTYRRLFRRLRALAPDVRYTVRPRSQPGLNWVWRVAGRPPSFPHTPDPPLLIDFPNMVFLFIGLMSSAIFEGICRGIPALYVREDPTVTEYVMPDMPECLPTGDVAFIEEEILKCRDAAYREALIRRQAAWYEIETGGAAT